MKEEQEYGYLHSFECIVQLLWKLLLSLTANPDTPATPVPSDTQERPTF